MTMSSLGSPSPPAVRHAEWTTTNAADRGAVPGAGLWFDSVAAEPDSISESLLPTSGTSSLLLFGGETDGFCISFQSCPRKILNSGESEIFFNLHP